jgi:hypothetical protein
MVFGVGTSPLKMTWFLTIQVVYIYLPRTMAFWCGILVPFGEMRSKLFWVVLPSMVGMSAYKALSVSLLVGHVKRQCSVVSWERSQRGQFLFL